MRHVRDKNCRRIGTGLLDGLLHGRENGSVQVRSAGLLWIRPANNLGA